MSGVKPMKDVVDVYKTALAQGLPPTAAFIEAKNEMTSNSVSCYFCHMNADSICSRCRTVHYCRICVAEYDPPCRHPGCLICGQALNSICFECKAVHPSGSAHEPSSCKYLCPLAANASFVSPPSSAGSTRSIWTPDELACFACARGGDLLRGCDCTGTAGWVHVACMVDTNERRRNEDVHSQCPTCLQVASGALRVAVAEEEWRRAKHSKDKHAAWSSLRELAGAHYARKRGGPSQGMQLYEQMLANETKRLAKYKNPTLEVPPDQPESEKASAEAADRLQDAIDHEVKMTELDQKYDDMLTELELCRLEGEQYIAQCSAADTQTLARGLPDGMRSWGAPSPSK